MFLDHVENVIACSDKSSKFNSFAVLDFYVFGGTNLSLMNECNLFCELLFLHL